jgi:hypothetical protein
MSRDVVVVAGALAQRPHRAGHAWVFVHWLLGLRGSGFHVVFVDRISAELGDVAEGVRWVRDVMTAAGFENAWSVLLADGTTAGIPRPDLVERVRGALLVNIMGYLDDEELLATVDRRVFLDLDPGFTQSWQANGLADLLRGHDAFATVGLNLGGPDCCVPDVGVDWIPTLPPVDLDLWCCALAPSGSFTTVGSWRGPFDPIDVNGRRYGLRAHEARAHADLPAHTGAPLEVALDIDDWDAADRSRLEQGGWGLRDPREVSSDLGVYRDYVHASLAEFAIAKQAYVGLRTGWFSDRSACYLASGRAVIVSDTSLPEWMCGGEGILPYRDVDEAAAAIDAVRAEPVRHGQAARDFARAHLDARLVARSLVERAA